MTFPYPEFPRSVFAPPRHHRPLFGLGFPSAVLPMHSTNLQSLSRAIDMTFDMDNDATVASCQCSCTTTTDNDSTIVEIDLPGVPKDAVSIDLKGRKLVVTGRRNPKSPDATSTPSSDATISNPPAATNGVTSHVTLNPQTPNTAPAPESPAPATVVHDEADLESNKPHNHNSNDDKGNHTNVQGPTNPITPGPANIPLPHTAKNAHKHCSMKARKETDDNSDNYNCNDHRARGILYKTVLHLGPQVDTESITVSHFRDGVLTLRLPHRKTSETRRIMIQ